MHDLLMAAFVGGFIALDRTAFLQIMISQPLVAGAILGFVLGDPVAGLSAGCVLQLLWIGDVPVGGSVPPNETAAAVIAASISSIAGRTAAGHTAPISLVIFSIVLSIPLAVLCQRVDIFVRTSNRRFVLRADRLLEERDFVSIGREHVKGLVSFFVASFVSIFLLLGVGLYFTRNIYPVIPERVLKGLVVSFPLLLSLGIAVSIRTARGIGKGNVPILFAGLLTGLLFVYLQK